MTEQRIELGIDGNAAFALLGEDIQSGECEFVEIPRLTDELAAKGHTETSLQLVACKVALSKLRDRLGQPDRPYYFGKSHPYGSDT